MTSSLLQAGKPEARHEPCGGGVHREEVSHLLGQLRQRKLHPQRDPGLLEKPHPQLLQLLTRPAGNSLPWSQRAAVVEGIFFLSVTVEDCHHSPRSERSSESETLIKF